MEYIRNHKDMKLLTAQKKNAQYVMNTSFKDGYPFLKELFAVEIEKTKIKLIKLKYLG